MQRNTLPALLVTAMLVSACGGENVRPDGSAGDLSGLGGIGAGGQTGQNGGANGGVTSGKGLGDDGIYGLDGPASAAEALRAAKEIKLENLDNPQNLLSTRVVYFNYNSTEIDEEYRDVLLAHGRVLADNPDVKIRLEGHTDERGSREYNIGLGNRRAVAVARMMISQGVDSMQIEPVSYGEEKPARFEHNEAAWRLNRRVKIVYVGF